VLELEADVESDLHRFHGIWTDLELDEFGNLCAERLFELIERLPAYDGAVAARIYSIQEEEKKRNPSYRAHQAGATEGDGSAAGLRANPELVGIVEVVQV